MSYSQQSINVKLNSLSSGGKEPDNNILFLLPKRILITQSLCYLTIHSEQVKGEILQNIKRKVDKFIID